MPRYTNDLNLPGPLFAAVVNDPYSRGDSDISVTQLIDPPRKVALEAEHAMDIVEDASDRIFSLMGQAVHVVLERANATGITEKRLATEVEGWKVSGAFDHMDLHEGTLRDWKVASVWEYVFGLRPEREQQLNLLAHLARINGYRVNKLEAVMIFRDWQKSKARTDDGNYPRKQVEVVEIPMWPVEVPNEFLRARVKLHQVAQRLAASRMDLIECTDEERWAKPTTYALKKEGRKSAIRVLASQQEAEEWAIGAKFARADYASDEHDRHSVSLERGYSIEERPGENTRCAMYCSALPFCSQAKALGVGEGDWISAATEDAASDLTNADVGVFA